MPGDAELALAVRGGDERAFRLLVERFKRPLYACVRRIAGEHEAAADALQDAFLQLWRTREALRPEWPVFPYLRRIAVNQALTRKRWERRRPAGLLGEADALVADGREGGAAAGAEEAEQVRAAFARLSPPLRACLSLRVNEELSYAEIAAALGVPRGTVMSRLARARAALARLLGREAAR